VRRVAAFVVRNWPLKIAALALATLLYAGLALSEEADVFREQIPIFPENQPEDAVLLTPTADLVVTSVSYVETRSVGPLSPDDFRATIDLSTVDPAGGPQSVPVRVHPLVPGIVVTEVNPQRVQVDLDPLVEATVPVIVDLGPPPANAEIGTVAVQPETVTVRGGQSVVEQVAGARATIPLDATGLDFRGDVEVIPIDRDGRELRVDVTPERVSVAVPVITALRQRTLPVNPVITGSVPAGMRVRSIEVAPPVVTVEGDADDVAPLLAIDTEPIPVTGVTTTLDGRFELALPQGVAAIGDGSVRVVIRMESITDTRAFGAALRPVGIAPGATASLSTLRVDVALFGPIALLDDLEARPLLGTVDATGLGAGEHELPVTIEVPDGVSVANVAPATVTLTIVGPATPSPAPFTPAPSPPASSPAP